MARDRRTLDMFDWSPPTMVRAFEAAKVRAASLRAMISKGVALALKECGKPRETISEEIGAYLGEDCPKSMLDAYASESREDHVINVVRFVALIHATRDIRLLNMIADQFGWAVIPKKYLAAAEEAIWNDRKEYATQQGLAARRRWKGGM
jgi:recombinational DNA repair protein (RecF pathway)